MDINLLRDRDNVEPFSVSELNNYIKNLFENNRTLSSVTVKGEISNFVNHRSGHLYFSLKDAEGQVRAVMFRSHAARLRFAPESGMKVIVHGSVTVYPRDGSYQIYVSSMQPDGIGALYLAYEQLKARLGAEGLFDQEHKMPLPRFPRRIGVITSPTGAAVRDIINVTGRRYPLAKVYLYPALVQGAGAEADLVSAVDYFDKSGLCDVIIIGRGGGSIEDLWAFNSEALARKIFECRIPIISAVGHETDFTICDFVSDMRAPTPSAAAELAVPDSSEIRIALDGILDRCSSALVRNVERARERLDRAGASFTAEKFSLLVGEKREELSRVYERAVTATDGRLERSRGDLAILTEKLSALSPLSVLSRGYSVVTRKGCGIGTVSDLEIGDRISVRFRDGSVTADVTEINEV